MAVSVHETASREQRHEHRFPTLWLPLSHSVGGRTGPSGTGPQRVSGGGAPARGTTAGVAAGGSPDGSAEVSAD
ncbi:hypothetical protein FHU32_001557 [Corynebacterium bovis DSM 20582 = CIP 54.80]|uniref:Uncharacterized protein n=1 Tax=Corynebacterium bovis DSM 20582 = CIP 54.80 TaxID=927655 RepID=A0A8I0CL80_9CORY|nr:hypothetical protein [Corynebacterium bovis DSM 20582 = CIP 54.80]